MASTESKIRIGIYGCGSWANRTHIPNLLKLDGVEIVAVCDSNPQSLANQPPKRLISPKPTLTDIRW